MNKTKIKSFTDLIAWQRGHQLACNIYKITTKFPSREQFGITSQMRRASISVTSNIAEGFGRQQIAEKIRFYVIGISSATELQSQIILAKDLEYLQEKDYEVLMDLIIQVLSLMNALVKKSRTFTKSWIE